MTWTIKVERKLADCWVGVYWDRTGVRLARNEREERLDVWVCIVPMLPIHIRRVRRYSFCYECGEPIGNEAHERHGRAGPIHARCLLAADAVGNKGGAC